MAQLKVVKDVDLGGPVFIQATEAAGQSYKAGDMVIIAAGAATILATNATLVSAIAQTDATGVTSAVGTFQLLKAGQLCEVALSSVPTIANQFVNYAVTVTSAGVNSINISETGHDFFVITDFLTNQITGLLTTTARGYILPACLSAVVGA